ncbi:MarR family winged helix-turn-helix transcriptional regulator [Kitasatospora sp. NPDC008115]|uniref:MarR family winged helix-turn-helix transcriptional regulator n=1 Tax=Kitasatospora sp. NPDC008115 TaxID=3364022 RepID=UPI0036E67039
MTETPDPAPIPHTGPPGAQVAFLLSQLGEHASQAFARRVAELDLTPAQAGLLRTVALAPGRHQQELARRLGMSPSRFVAFVDAIEARGLVERRRNPKDRRFQDLYLAPKGEEAMRGLAEAAFAHEEAICTGLDPQERIALAELLRRVAEAQHLTAGVHPGYRRLDPGRDEA